MVLVNLIYEYAKYGSPKKNANAKSGKVIF